MYLNVISRKREFLIYTYIYVRLCVYVYNMEYCMHIHIYICIYIIEHCFIATHAIFHASKEKNYCNFMYAHKLV